AVVAKRVLSLARREVESSTSVDRKSAITTQARRKHQACEQCKAARPRLEAAIPYIRGGDGKEHLGRFQARWRLTDAAVSAVRPGKTPVWKLLFSERMRQIKLTGREATVVRAIGFAESMLGAGIQDFTRMELDDGPDALNSLMAAGVTVGI